MLCPNHNICGQKHMGAAADCEQGGRLKPWTPAAGRAVIFSLGFLSLLSASPAGRCRLSRFWFGSHKSDFCCPFYFFQSLQGYVGTETTRLRAQVLTSKLTWLSKEKLAQRHTEEMGGEFVLAGRGSSQIPFSGSQFWCVAGERGQSAALGDFTNFSGFISAVRF